MLIVDMFCARLTPAYDLKDAKALLLSLGLEAVVCVETGGRPLGRLLAEDLRLPLVGLDVRYPGTRLLDKVPRRLIPLLWPLKELAYKVTTPRPVFGDRMPTALSAYRRLALVDDSASSGKTMQTALDHLTREDISRDRVTTIVGRCGKRAAHLVDFVLKVGA